MNGNNWIIRRSIEKTDEYTIKSETTSYCNITGAQRTVCQTFVQPNGQPATKSRKIVYDCAASLPRIAIKKEHDPHVKTNSEIILINGSWDISNSIPNIVAEMSSIKGEELKALEIICDNKYKPKQNNYGIQTKAIAKEIKEPENADGNLSWLLNFKINELPPVPEDKCENTALCFSSSNGVDELDRNDYFDDCSNTGVSDCRVSESEVRCSDKDQENSDNYPCRYFGPKKPPFTYTELIEHALSEKGDLTVSGIYQWISEHFPFYKQHDDRWKNSVRHNLSINPHFRKGNKAVHGAGHLWTIAQRDDKKSMQINQRMQQFIQTNHNQDVMNLELQAATTSILNKGSYNKDSNVDHVQFGERERKKNRNIQIEYINVIDITNGLEDFLSPPVSKQQLVHECGLGNDVFVADSNSDVISLQDSGSINEEIVYDDASLEYFELQN